MLSEFTEVEVLFTPDGDGTRVDLEHRDLERMGERADAMRETVSGTAHVIYGSTEAEPIASVTVDEMLVAMEEGGEEGLCAGRPVPVAHGGTPIREILA